MGHSLSSLLKKKPLTSRVCFICFTQKFYVCPGTSHDCVHQSALAVAARWGKISQPNQRRILNKLPTELRHRNFVNKHRLSMQIGANGAKLSMQRLHILTELPFCTPPLVVGKQQQKQQQQQQPTISPLFSASGNDMLYLPPPTPPPHLAAKWPHLIPTQPNPHPSSRWKEEEGRRKMLIIFPCDRPIRHPNKMALEKGEIN